MESLTQDEADELLNMHKRTEVGSTYRFPAKGERLSIPLHSLDEREAFHVDVNRRSIALYKCTFNGRARGNIMLARLDLNGAPHRNPDGQEIGCPHLHLYREGYGDKWAFPIPSESFSDLSDLAEVLRDFMVYFKVIIPPTIALDLLS
ncbi:MULTISPECIES: hypothetical protein [unclassified Pannonibacter]|uniref:DUF6978 family protein n=1 Tax=unclassified Pannonibacter TaxID=2627228 RepID=UPI0016465F5D|nr:MULTISPECIES: hypothetical protein [unclassified Pannonibacter]